MGGGTIQSKNGWRNSLGNQATEEELFALAAKMELWVLRK